MFCFFQKVDLCIRILKPKVKVGLDNSSFYNEKHTTSKAAYRSPWTTRNLAKIGGKFRQYQGLIVSIFDREISIRRILKTIIFKIKGNRVDCLKDAWAHFEKENIQTNQRIKRSISSTGFKKWSQQHFLENRAPAHFSISWRLRSEKKVKRPHFFLGDEFNGIIKRGSQWQGREIEGH